ncbi:putative Trichohyalin-plectin-homology domain containing protein [Blattamonas nauphoetae]|uniref:Trichohyalin-plectin-homology domain containing protein n=1 Tax=Blattamonas nauphoetae TaxID=2049346 RepID=A0ABQ9XQE9_9EUKA|nr:putative Trichohyalin-plectin-homology domain containing protein [Blattamonas nauphoetae]
MSKTKTNTRTRTKPLHKDKDVTVLTQPEYERMWCMVQPPQKDRSAELAKQQLRERSMARSRNWPDSFQSVAERRQKEADDRIKAREAELARIDEEERQYQQLQKEEYLLRAAKRLHDEDDVSRMLASKRMLTEANKERERQKAVKQHLEKLQKEEDQAYHDYMMQDLENQTRKMMETEQQRYETRKQIARERREQLEDNIALRSAIIEEEYFEGQMIQEDARRAEQEEKQKEQERRLKARQLRLENDELMAKARTLVLTKKKQEEEEEEKRIEDARKKDDMMRERMRAIDEEKRLELVRKNAVFQQMEREMVDQAAIERALLEKQVAEAEKKENEKIAREKEKRRKALLAMNEARDTQKTLKQRQLELEKRRKQREYEEAVKISNELAQKEIEEAEKKRQRALEVDAYRKQQFEATVDRERTLKARTLQQEIRSRDMMQQNIEAELLAEIKKCEEDGLDPKPLIIGYNQMTSTRLK